MHVMRNNDFVCEMRSSGEIDPKHTYHYVEKIPISRYLTKTNMEKIAVDVQRNILVKLNEKTKESLSNIFDKSASPLRTSTVQVRNRTLRNNSNPIIDI